jgi:hypothetical protein
MKEGPSRKLGYRPADVQVLFGSVQIYRDVVEAGWLKPIIQRKRLTVFDHADVLRVWERIRRGEYPRTSSGTRNGG